MPGSVASIEPETATQWAMTLPPGKDRDQTLKTIHSNWPKKIRQARKPSRRSTGSSEPWAAEAVQNL